MDGAAGMTLVLQGMEERIDAMEELLAQEHACVCVCVCVCVLAWTSPDAMTLD